MASYADRFKKPEEQLPLAYACLEPLRDICPAVRELLMGVVDDNGIEIVKPASIGIFMDGSRLKFVIRPKDHGEQCWGVIDDCRNPFTAIEHALLENLCEWKEKKSSQFGSTQEPIPY